LNVYWPSTPKRAKRPQKQLDRHVEAPEHAPIEPNDLIETPARKASRGDL
jgi:hypothetical protein